MDNYEQFDIVEATFAPMRRDNLIPGVEAWIGWHGRWQAWWVIETGPYAGQWAFGLETPAIPPAPFVWVPAEDLQNVVSMDAEG